MSSIKMRILCLHGKRTSGKIMSMQTSAMRYHTPIDCSFIDAPFPAEGPADEGILTYYPDYPYYEWFYRRKGDNEEVIHEGLDQSIDFVLNYLRTNGPFDGLLGFSQGGGFVSLLAYLQHNRLKGFDDKPLFQFVILIGSVEPMGIIKQNFRVDLPSLHITGKADQYHSRSLEVIEYYKNNNKNNTTLLLHEEGHQIPSIRTELYPHISNWIHSLRQTSISNNNNLMKNQIGKKDERSTNNVTACQIC